MASVITFTVALHWRILARLKTKERWNWDAVYRVTIKWCDLLVCQWYLIMNDTELRAKEMRPNHNNNHTVHRCRVCLNVRFCYLLVSFMPISKNLNWNQCTCKSNSWNYGQITTFIVFKLIINCLLAIFHVILIHSNTLVQLLTVDLFTVHWYQFYALYYYIYKSNVWIILIALNHWLFVYDLILMVSLGFNFNFEWNEQWLLN